MEQKKRPLGYRTPNMQIQEEYEGILAQLKKKKANWEEILTLCENHCTSLITDADNTIKKIESKKEPTREYVIGLEHKGLLLGISVTDLMVARTGKELAECHVRISDIEKELKTLRRGLS